MTPSDFELTDMEQIHYARSTQSLYPFFAAAFCGLLIISNIGATKLIHFGPIITDGGAFLFPLVYIVGDVLTEVYGFKAARKVIYIGFGNSLAHDESCELHTGSSSNNGAPWPI